MGRGEHKIREKGEQQREKKKVSVWQVMSFYRETKQVDKKSFGQKESLLV